MNNFYHKVTFASVGIVLGFALGTHKEAKAATFIFTETSSYHFANQDELPDWGDNRQSLYVGITDPNYLSEEYRTFYKFNISSLLDTPNIVITNAILDINVFHIRWYRPHSKLQVYGFTQNDKVDYRGVYNSGEYLDQLTIGEVSTKRIVSFAKRRDSFDVLQFITERVENNNSFAGFGIRFLNGEGFITLDREAHLIVTTANVSEPVPEPTTIFGSGIGLGLGGWLKRKKSALQNKTAPQN